VLRGHQVTIQIRTELEHARDLLAQSLPQLRDSLAQQGIAASRVTVELGLGGSSRDASGRGFAGFRPPAPAGSAAPSRADVAGASRRPATPLGAFDVWV